MVASAKTARKPLVSAALLTQAAAHGAGVDLRGLSFGPRHTHTPAEHALMRAQAEGLVAAHIAGAHWTVTSGSEAGKVYHITSNGHTSCTCPAGAHGHVCKHAALVSWTRRQQSARGAAAKAASDVAEALAVTIIRLEDLYSARETW